MVILSHEQACTMRFLDGWALAGASMSNLSARGGTWWKLWRSIRRSEIPSPFIESFRSRCGTLRYREARFKAQSSGYVSRMKLARHLPGVVLILPNEKARTYVDMRNWSVTKNEYFSAQTNLIITAKAVLAYVNRRSVNRWVRIYSWSPVKKLTEYVCALKFSHLPSNDESSRESIHQNRPICTVAEHTVGSVSKSTVSRDRIHRPNRGKCIHRNNWGPVIFFSRFRWGRAPSLRSGDGNRWKLSFGDDSSSDDCSACGFVSGIRRYCVSWWWSWW